MTTHKGVYYFPSLDAARTFAVSINAPTDRIIRYTFGYAIQWHRSGTYVGPEATQHQGCAWCPVE